MPSRSISTCSTSTVVSTQICREHLVSLVRFISNSSAAVQCAGKNGSVSLSTPSLSIVSRRSSDLVLGSIGQAYSISPYRSISLWRASRKRLEYSNCLLACTRLVSSAKTLSKVLLADDADDARLANISGPPASSAEQNSGAEILGSIPNPLSIRSENRTVRDKSRMEV